MAKLLEQFSDIAFTFIAGDILDVNIIDKSSHLPSIFWLEFHLMNAFR